MTDVTPSQGRRRATMCASTARKKYGLSPRRLLVSRTQLDKLEERGCLDPDRRGDRADEAEAIETFLMDALTKRCAASAPIGLSPSASSRESRLR
jgi:hypothetical protein